MTSQRYSTQSSLFSQTSRDRKHLYRRTDPSTSREAARSVNLSASRREVLEAAWCVEEFTDSYLCITLARWGSTLSHSGIRTRRNELVKLGLIHNTGKKDVLPSGRRAIVWATT